VALAVALATVEPTTGTVDDAPAWIARGVRLSDGHATPELLAGMRAWKQAHEGSARGAPWEGTADGEIMLPGRLCVYAEGADSLRLSDGSRVSLRGDTSLGVRYTHPHDANSFRAQARDAALTDGQRLAGRIGRVAGTVSAILADIAHLPDGEAEGRVGTILANLRQVVPVLGNAAQAAGQISGTWKMPPAPAKAHGGVVYTFNLGDRVILTAKGRAKWGPTLIDMGEAVDCTLVYRKSVGDLYKVVPPHFGAPGYDECLPFSVEKGMIEPAPPPAP